jgi:hypothetical protein
MTEHPYDNPALGPREFLLAVLNDPTVPLPDRQKAAWHLDILRTLDEITETEVPSFLYAQWCFEHHLNPFQWATCERYCRDTGRVDLDDFRDFLDFMPVEDTHND